MINPSSYYYGETPFPWEGLIVPKLFQRYQWLLVLVPVVGKVSVICVQPTMSASSDIVLKDGIRSCISRKGIDIIETDVSSTIDICSIVPTKGVKVK